MRITSRKNAWRVVTLTKNIADQFIIRILNWFMKYWT